MAKKVGKGTNWGVRPRRRIATLPFPVKKKTTEGGPNINMCRSRQTSITTKQKVASGRNALYLQTQPYSKPI